MVVHLLAAILPCKYKRREKAESVFLMINYRSLCPTRESTLILSWVKYYEKLLQKHTPSDTDFATMWIILLALLWSQLFGKYLQDHRKWGKLFLKCHLARNTFTFSFQHISFIALHCNQSRASPRLVFYLICLMNQTYSTHSESYIFYYERYVQLFTSSSHLWCSSSQ